MREVVQAIREIVAAGEHVKHVNEVLTLHMGPEYIVATISLDFVDDVPAGGSSAPCSCWRRRSSAGSRR